MDLLDFKDEFHMQLVQQADKELDKFVIIVRRARLDTERDFSVSECYDLTARELKDVQTGLAAMHRRIEEYLKEHPLAPLI